MYERTFNMAFRKNKSAPAREACMDDSLLNLLLVITAVILLFAIMLSVYFTVALVSRVNDPEAEGDDTSASADADYPFRQEGITVNIPSTEESKNTIAPEFMSSEKAILVDVTANEIVASRQGSQLIYPASLTKVMTLIVVAENLQTEDSLNDVITIEHERGENSGYIYIDVDEKLTVRDLIYAAILESDGVACLALADYIAGSEANFVKLMNEKAAELGIGDTTLFQNCTGLHHQYHYSTCRDIAIIMAYAVQNPFCRSVLCAFSYSDVNEDFRPDIANKIFYHNLLNKHLNGMKTQPQNAEILGGKTGWTGSESGHCVVAYVKGNNGHYYISVTAKAETMAANIQDTINLFNEYVK